MKIEIENYFGSTVAMLEFPQVSEPRVKLAMSAIGEIAVNLGFDVADYEDENHIRLQHVNVDEDENDELEYYNLIKDVTHFVML